MVPMPLMKPNRTIIITRGLCLTWLIVSISERINGGLVRRLFNEERKENAVLVIIIISGKIITRNNVPNKNSCGHNRRLINLYTSEIFSGLDIVSVSYGDQVRP